MCPQIDRLYRDVLVYQAIAQSLALPCVSKEIIQSFRQLRKYNNMEKRPNYIVICCNLELSDWWSFLSKNNIVMISVFPFRFLQI